MLRIHPTKISVVLQTLLHSLLHESYHWAEAWAPLIAIAAWWMFGRKNAEITHPVVWYFVGAFLLGTGIDLIWKLNDYMPPYLRNNNVLYNTQSIFRALIFGLFFNRTLKGKFRQAMQVAAAVYAVFIVANYVFISGILQFSSFGIAAESILQMFIGILFLFQLLNDDDDKSYARMPAFWFSVGLTLYAAVDFSTFLIYSMLIDQNLELATEIWGGHNAFYIVFCLLCAMGFYESRR